MKKLLFLGLLLVLSSNLIKASQTEMKVLEDKPAYVEGLIPKELFDQIADTLINSNLKIDPKIAEKISGPAPIGVWAVAFKIDPEKELYLVPRSNGAYYSFGTAKKEGSKDVFTVGKDLTKSDAWVIRTGIRYK
jgi:hypothetical protein